MDEKASIRKFLTDTCPEEVVREVYSCVANVPNLEFMFSGSRRMAQRALMQYKRDPNKIFPSYFPLYGDGLFGVDVVLRGELNVLLISFLHIKNQQLFQRNILFVVKEG